jgi:Rrf2 family protein
VELSSKVEYALLALIELASLPNRGEPLKISQISDKQAIPDRYLEQILNSLRRSGIIQSLRGAKGGYVLARAPQKITLLEIMISVEGDSKLQQNQVSETATLEKKITHELWMQVIEETQALLSRYTLEDFCQRRDALSPLSLMYYI